GGGGEATGPGGRTPAPAAGGGAGRRHFALLSGRQIGAGREQETGRHETGRGATDLDRPPAPAATPVADRRTVDDRVGQDRGLGGRVDNRPEERRDSLAQPAQRAAGARMGADWNRVENEVLGLVPGRRQRH